MRKAVGIVLWWAALLGLWQLYVGQTTKETTIAGAIGAALAVVAGAFLARLGLYPLGLDPQRLRSAAALPWHLVRDFWVVTAAIARGRPEGAFVEVDLPVRSAGDRALVGLLGSIAPNAYVVDFERDRGAVVLHELDPERSKGRPL